MDIMVNIDNAVIGYSKEDETIGSTDEKIKIIRVDNIPEDFLPNKYLYVNGEYTLNPNFKTPLPLEIRKRITELKYKLQQTDYMVIKYQEYILVGLEPPLEYDIQKIHNDRQKIRDEINQLENQQ